MKVLFVSDVYFPRVNGVSTSIRTFRDDLAACGVQTLLVAPAYGAAANARPDADGVIRVSSARVPGDPEDRRMRWRSLRSTLDGLADARVDLVHVHTPFLAHYAGSAFARRQGLPCVVTYHTFFEEYLHHYVPALPRAFGRLVARRISRAQCDAVQAIVAPSEPMRSALADYGVRTPVEVLPTGIPADRFRPGDRQRFRARLGIDSHRPVLGYVGRCAHEKNIEFLLDAVALVRRRIPDVLLIVAGEGPARDGLERRTRDMGLAYSVRFEGYLDRATDLLDCYASLDAFVFASRTETQGLVLLEAMAQGIPVVALAELGTRSILREGEGALVPPGDRESFAAAAIRVLEDAGLRAQLSRSARSHAARWSSRAMAGSMADLYRRVCGRAIDAGGAAAASITPC